MSSILLPNKLGWVTHMELSQSIDSAMTGRIEFMAHDPGTLMKFMNDLRIGRDFGPSRQKEFMCLHCATPNPIERAFCSQCGAARSFVIG